jgi:hypothetical protein
VETDAAKGHHPSPHGPSLLLPTTSSTPAPPPPSCAKREARTADLAAAAPCLRPFYGLNMRLCNLFAATMLAKLLNPPSVVKAESRMTQLHAVEKASPWASKFGWFNHGRCQKAMALRGMKDNVCALPLEPIDCPVFSFCTALCFSVQIHITLWFFIWDDFHSAPCLVLRDIHSAELAFSLNSLANCYSPALSFLPWFARSTAFL